jgi:tetrahydromethanopterin S-methyltransferase subunit G
MRKENTEDHGKVMNRLDKVQESVDHVAVRLDDHIDWHLKK